MPVGIGKTYITYADKIFDDASSSEWFNMDSYNESVNATGSGEDYLGLIYSIKHYNELHKDDGKKIEDFNLNLDDYKYLNQKDKIGYLSEKVYGDPNSQEYKEAMDYFAQQIEKGKQQEIYENTSTIGKIFANIGSGIAHVVKGFVDVAEGVIDALATGVGTFVSLFDKNAEKAIKDFIGVDYTDKMFAGLKDFDAKYTIMDKGVVGEILTGITEGLGALAWNLIPGVGTAIYWTGMVGQGVEQAIAIENAYGLDNSIWASAAIGAGLGGIEAVTEKLIGARGIQKLVFKGTSRAATNVGGSAFKRIGTDFAKEGLEEMASELAGDMLTYWYSGYQSEEAPTLKDILVAGLVGSVIGGSVAGLGIATTQRVYVTTDGDVITQKVVEEARKGNNEAYAGAKLLTKIETLNAKDIASKMSTIDNMQNVTKLQKKYNMSTEQLQKEHTDEYNEARAADDKITNDALKDTLWFSNLLTEVGADAFMKAEETYRKTADFKFQLLKNWANNQTLKSKITDADERRIIEKFERENPGVNLSFREDLNSQEINMRKALAAKGINLYFADFGAENADFYSPSFNVDDKTIVVRKDLSNKLSLEQIQRDVIKHEVVHSFQRFLTTLNPKQIMILHKLLLQAYGNKPIPTTLDEAYKDLSNITKISEMQADALAEVLVDDQFSIDNLFLGKMSLFGKIFNFFSNMRKTIKKEDGTVLKKIRYNYVNKVMNKYKQSILSYTGNEEDMEKIKSELDLTDEEAIELTNTYLQDKPFSKVTVLTKDQISFRNANRIQAERIITNNRKTSSSDPIDWDNVFDITLYKDEFVQEIMNLNPQRDFKYNLQTLLINYTNFQISQKNRCMVESVVLDDEFKPEIMNLNDVKSLNNKTGKDLFKESFAKKFTRTDGTNTLDDIKIQIKPARSRKFAESNYVGKPTPTIIIYSDKIEMNKLNRATFLGVLMQEVTHALADVNGVAKGTTPDIVERSIRENVSEKDLHFIAQQLLTKEYYNQIKNDKNTLINTVAYAVYGCTDGEVLRSDRQATKKIGAKPQYFTNDNGFVNVLGGIQGFGIFKNITIPQPIDMTTAMKIEIREMKKSSDELLYKRPSKKPEESSIETNKEKFLKHFDKDYKKRVGKQLLSEEEGVNEDLAIKILRKTVTKYDIENAIRDGTLTNEEIIQWYIDSYYSDNKNIKTIADINKSLKRIKKESSYANNYNDDELRYEIIRNDFGTDTAIDVIDKKLKRKEQTAVQRTFEQVELDTVTGVIGGKENDDIETEEASTSDEALVGEGKGEYGGDAIRTGKKAIRNIEDAVEEAKPDEFLAFRRAVIALLNSAPKRLTTRKEVYEYIAELLNKIASSNNKLSSLAKALLDKAENINMSIEEYLENVAINPNVVYEKECLFLLDKYAKTKEDFNYFRNRIFQTTSKDIAIPRAKIFKPEQLQKVRDDLKTKFKELYSKNAKKPTLQSELRAKTEKLDEPKVIEKTEKKPSKPKQLTLDLTELPKAKKESKPVEKKEVKEPKGEQLSFLDERSKQPVVKREAKLGQNVTLVRDDGKKQTFSLVEKEYEDKRYNRISIDSPLGKRLTGKHVGDKLEYTKDGKKVTYTIDSIMDSKVKPEKFAKREPIMKIDVAQMKKDYEEGINEFKKDLDIGVDAEVVKKRKEKIEATENPQPVSITNIEQKMAKAEKFIAMTDEVKLNPRKKTYCSVDSYEVDNAKGHIENTNITFEILSDTSSPIGVDGSTITEITVKDGSKVIAVYKDGQWTTTPDDIYIPFIKLIVGSYMKLESTSPTTKEGWSKGLVDAISPDPKKDRFSVRISTSHVKRMTAAEEIYMVADMRKFLYENEDYLEKFSADDFKEFLDKCCDPSKSFNLFEQTRIAILATWIKNQEVVFKNREGFKELYERLDNYLSLMGSLSGQRMYLLSVLSKANPLLGMERIMKEKYNVELKSSDFEIMIGDEKVDLKKEYTKALHNQNYKRLSELEPKLMEIISNKIPNNKCHIFESGISFKERKQRWVNLLTEVNSFRYMAMLSNISTHAVNVVSNFGIKVLESASYSLLNLFANSKIYSDVPNQLKYRDGRVSQELKEQVRTEFDDAVDYICKEGKYSEHMGTNVLQDAERKKMFTSKIGKWFFQPWHNLIFKWLSKADTWFTKPALRKEIANLIQANYNGSIEEAKKHKELILENATRRVMHSYLRDENILSNFMNNIKSSYPTLGWLMNVVLPFPRVTYNITRRVLEFSPIGLGHGIVRLFKMKFAKKSMTVKKQQASEALKLLKDKNLTKEQEQKLIDDEIIDRETLNKFKKGEITYEQAQQRVAEYVLLKSVFDDQFYAADTQLMISRGVVGTAMIALGALLSALGWLEFDDDDEYNGIVCKVGDVKFSLSSIAPSLTPLLLGAAFKYNDIHPKRRERLMSVLNDATVLGTFNNLFTYKTELLSYVTEPASTYFTQFVPAILRSISKIGSSKKQISYDYNTLPGWFSTTLQRVQSSIPFARNLLPDKIDPYTGKPIEEYGSKWILSFINIAMPAKISKDTDSALSNELKSQGIGTTGAQGEMTINGNKITLQGKQKSQMQADRGKYVNLLMNELISNRQRYSVKTENGTYKNKLYKDMTDKEKQQVATTLYTKATKYATINYWIKQGHSYYTSSRDEYNDIREVLGYVNGVRYRANWNKSKYVK